MHGRAADYDTTPIDSSPDGIAQRARHGTSRSIAGDVQGLVQFHRVGETCILLLSMETPFRELKSEVAVIHDLLISQRWCAKRSVARP